MSWSLMGLVVIIIPISLVGRVQAQEFSKERIITGPCAPCEVESIVTLDVDTDGDEDVVVGSGFPYIGWFENTENGFARFKRLNKDIGVTISEVEANLKTKDISGDGRNDLLVNYSGAGFWYENQGGGLLSNKKSVRGADFGDVTGDGDEEVVFLKTDAIVAGTDDFVNPTKTTEIATVADVPPTFEFVELADLTGSGIQDVLYATGTLTDGFKVKWFESLGEAGFGGGQVIDESSGRRYWGKILTMDVDGDGDQDLVTPRWSNTGDSGKLSWYENTDGAGSFSEENVLVETKSSSPPATLLDVDGDGDLDLVSRTEQGIVWYENVNDGTFAEVAVLDSNAPTALRTGDLNGDGRADLLGISADARGFTWYPNLQDGRLGEPRTVGKEIDVVRNLLDQSTDLDKNGYENLLVGVPDTNTVRGFNLSSLKNRGSGYNAPEQILPAFPLRLAVAQIDGNTTPDLLYTQVDTMSEETPPPEILSWAKNDGSEFSHKTIRESGFASITSIDVDGDGDPDPIAFNTASDAIEVYQNQNGTINGSPVEVGGQKGAKNLIGADIDGDGEEDLIVNYWGSRGGVNKPAALVWRENTHTDWDFGAGQDGFSEAKIIDESDNDNGLPQEVAPADVDSDGDVDLITYGRSQGETRWYENLDGEGSFSAPKSLDFGAIGRRVRGENYRVADVDGDSDPDVLAFDGPFNGATYRDNAHQKIDYGSRTIWWHENQGGSFRDRRKLINGTDRPRALRTFDSDKGGTIDIAYLSKDYRKVAWYKNQEAVVASRSMSAGETAAFSEASTQISLSSSTQGSGTVTVRRPFSDPFDSENQFSFVFGDRFVLETDADLSIGTDSEVRFDASTVEGLRKPEGVTIYARDTVDRGSFRQVPTSYNADTDQLIATTDQFGEFVLTTGADKQPPDVPKAPLASASAQEIKLEWTASDSADVADYRIYRSKAPIDSSAGPSGVVALDTVSVETTTYVDGAVQKDVTYHYRVTAVDDNLNESGFSKEVRIGPDSVRITSVRPRWGGPGTPIRIHGVGFALRDADVSATIGGDPAHVDSATTQTIYAQVPDRAGGLAELSVTSAGTTAVASERFGVVTGGEAEFAPNEAALAGLREIGALDAADYDGDGNLDLALCGTDTTGTTTSGVYENQGDGTFERANVGVPGDLSFCNLSWGDYDGDGDPDLLANGTLYENKGEVGFDAVASNLGDGPWVDVDKDGDLDLGASYLYEGDGTFTEVQTNGISGSGAFAWADYDGDGDLDVAFVGREGSSRQTAIYENKGDSTFAKIGAGLTDLDEGAAAWGDYDRDGDPDLVVAGESGSGKKTILYENKGGGSFEPVQADLTGVGRVVRTLSWGDFDGSGTLDLLLIGENSNSNLVTTLYANRGSGTFEPSGTAFEGLDTISRGWSGDFSGDGALDLILSGEDDSFNGKALLYENGKPSAPPSGLSASVGADSVALKWTPPAAMDVDKYRVYRDTAAIDSTAGPSALGAYASTAVGDTTYVDTDVRPDTTYHYRVTAVDTASNESAFSGEVTVTAGLPNVSFADGRNGFPFDPSPVDPIDEYNPVGRFVLTGNRKGSILSALTVKNDGSALQGVTAVELWSSSDGTFWSAVDQRLASVETASPAVFEDIGFTVPSDSAYLFVVVKLSRTAGGNYAPMIQNEEALTLTSGELASVNGTEDTTFTQAYLSTSATALPVELAGFGASVDGAEVRLQWKTASETGNAGFEVQRRAARPAGAQSEAEESLWTAIGRVEGAGTTSEPQSYRFVDEDLPFEADSLTYRLKQIDTDGSAHYSEAITVERGVDEVQLLGTYPNPARQRATVRYALPEKQEVTIRLYDVLGRRVQTLVRGKKEGRHKRTMDVDRVPSGVYFLRLRAEGQTRTQKVTVVR